MAQMTAGLDSDYQNARIRAANARAQQAEANAAIAQARAQSSASAGYQDAKSQIMDARARQANANAERAQARSQNTALLAAGQAALNRVTSQNPQESRAGAFDLASWMGQAHPGSQFVPALDQYGRVIGINRYAVKQEPTMRNVNGVMTMTDMDTRSAQPVEQIPVQAAVAFAAHTIDPKGFAAAVKEQQAQVNADRNYGLSRERMDFEKQRYSEGQATRAEEERRKFIANYVTQNAGLSDDPVGEAQAKWDAITGKAQNGPQVGLGSQPPASQEKKSGGFLSNVMNFLGMGGNSQQAPQQPAQQAPQSQARPPAVDYESAGLGAAGGQMAQPQGAMPANREMSNMSASDALRISRLLEDRVRNGGDPMQEFQRLANIPNSGLSTNDLANIMEMTPSLRAVIAQRYRQATGSPSTFEPREPQPSGQIAQPIASPPAGRPMYATPEGGRYEPMADYGSAGLGTDMRRMDRETPAPSTAGERIQPLQDFGYRAPTENSPYGPSSHENVRAGIQSVGRGLGAAAEAVGRGAGAVGDFLNRSARAVYELPYDVVSYLAPNTEQDQYRLGR